MFNAIKRSVSSARRQRVRFLSRASPPASSRLVAYSSIPSRPVKYPQERFISRSTLAGQRDVTVDLHNAISSLERSLEDMQAYVKSDRVEQDIQRTQAVLEDPQLWIMNPAGAAKAQSRLADLQHQLSTRTRISSSLNRLKELAALAEKAEDFDLQSAVLLELRGLLRSAEEHLISLLLSDPVDQNSAYITVTADSEGVEACDWVSMLIRMYTKWAHSKNYVVTTVDQTPGDPTRLKAATLLVEGRYAYGYTQYESGVHSVVHVLPSDGAGVPRTSFATVRVSPCIEDDGPGDVVELEPADLQIITGGAAISVAERDVGETASAVRVTHIPTGITVSCQQERSQHQNQALALSLLKARLYDLELQKRGQSATDAQHRHLESSRDSPIRSYTLQSDHQLVKDLRTGFEVGSDAVQHVLDGNLTGFMEASLRKFKKK
ncbi:release factor [Trametes cingulata]|nr:release factor [Trametes cingulata]